MSKKNDNDMKNVKLEKNKFNFIEKLTSFFSSGGNKVTSNKYKRKKLKKSKRKRMVNGKFSLDIFDLLIIIVVTVTISSVFTGLILNFQYKKNIAYLNSDNVSTEYISEFVDIYTEIVDNFYEEVDQKGMLDAALEGMLVYLEDNYSIYLDKEATDELTQNLDGSYQGIGIVAYGNVVTYVYDNSPAAKVGMKINDEIIKINENDIDMYSGDKITESLKSDEENIIVVKRDGKEIELKLNVSKVYIPSTSETVINSKDKKIGYIALSTFSFNSAEDFQNSLLKLSEDEIDSLIVDLRNNTGGYLNSAFNIANIFLEKGKIVYSLESKDGVTDFKDSTKQSLKYKVVVLVNQASASASEVLAAALKDSYGATVVGMTTFGKGSVQTTKKYGDTMLKYTSAKWLRPNGECVDEIGIIPDYEVEVIIKDNVKYDKQLDKAIELLS